MRLKREPLSERRTDAGAQARRPVVRSSRGECGLEEGVHGRAVRRAELDVGGAPLGSRGIR